MDQKKIGEFLRTLRKEKGLTQEQLAEEFNVSGRTVSRWETGSNMPDISIVSEIADFYEIDIRELIDGERKNEPVPEEETVSKIIEYADGENTHLSKRVMVSSIVGLICLLAYVIVSRYDFISQGLIKDLIETVLLFFVYSSIVYSISFTSGRLEKKIERRKGMSLKRKLLFALILLGALFILVNIATFLLIESA